MFIKKPLLKLKTKEKVRTTALILVKKYFFFPIFNTKRKHSNTHSRPNYQRFILLQWQIRNKITAGCDKLPKGNTIPFKRSSLQKPPRFKNHCSHKQKPGTKIFPFSQRLKQIFKRIANHSRSIKILHKTGFEIHGF